MITKIGIVAGDVWNYLERKGGKGTLEEIIPELEKDRDLILMGIGWLAREGHVKLEGEGVSRIVCLQN